MQTIINLPSFIFFDKDLKNLNKIQKLLLLIKGIYFILVFKYTKNSLFCFLCNLIYGKNGKISFVDNMYTKQLENNKIYYPNKRIVRVMVDHNKQFDKLFRTYALDKISFDNNDLVLDCGANVGELFFSFKYNNLDIQYMGFEPDKDVFKCLEQNINNGYQVNKALGKENTTKKLFIDSEGANTSLVNFGTSSEYEVDTITLDSLKLDNVKLLKMDAEGYEPEVLLGATNSLNKINLISVEYGNERGVEEKSTIVEVTNFLYNHGFKLVADSRERKIGLFENKVINV